MMTADQFTPRKIYFLDNMRYLMVFLVIPLHALLSYFPVAGVNPFVSDAAHGQVSPLIFIFLESFPMEILFFIAGYFALSSLQKEGCRSFVVRKLKRLGIPLLLVIFFSNAILYYIQAYTESKDMLMPSLWSVWIKYLQKIFTPHLGIVDLSSDFHPQIYWFLMVLLSFFLIFATLYWIIEKITEVSIKQQDADSPKYNLIIMILFGCIGGIGYFVANFFYLDKDWLSIGNIIVFRPTRVSIYIAFFTMGIYAYLKHWFSKIPLPGKILPYAISLVLLFFPLVALVVQVHVHNSSSLLIHFAHGFIRSFFCISALCLLINIEYSHFNKFSRINQKLAENSYNIYLLHFVIVVLFQLFFLRFTEMPVSFKFVAVTLFSWAVCFIVSNYFLKPYPKIFVASMITLFFILTALM